MTVAALQAMDALSRRATMLRDSLRRSQGNTDGMVTILGSFDHRLSALEAAMRPTQVRTHAIRTAHENIDRTIKAADGILSQFDLARRAEATILRGPHEDLESYLEAVDVLKGISRFFSSNKNFKSSEGVLNHVNNLLAKSTLKIEEEFKQLMSTYRDYRASALEVSLRKLGVEKLTKDDVQKMQWEALEAKIGNWIHFMRIAVKLLLAGERKICDQIFDGVNFNKGHCFAELTANSIITLFSFGDAVAKSKRSPEKLFVLLDMYEVMRELQPEIDEIFEGKPCTEMREAASSLTKRLAQTAQETFADFEEAVEKDASKTIVQDGTVHPLTSYVINYVKFLFDYQSTLKLLFQEFDSGTEAESQLAAVTTRIMQALQNNLDGKSKQYKDPALTHLFLMNNIHYMVRSVRRSEAKDILGDDWIQRHRRIVQQNANQYKRVAWAKILQTLSVQGAGSGGDLTSSSVSRATIKERFKSFNTQFEELHAKQSQWIVPDQELRESLRLAVAEVLLPAYRSFIKRFGNLVDNNKNPQKYVRYSPEAVDQLLGQFFEGQQWAEQKR
ncbi:hypothetical protein Zm00014a_042902 [Zea mays]|uniref:Exocyst subunit Exo70 family protein n=2 Tax=Zea mays TaxID=4577 RepID=A0A8J8XLS3_MAIZE|nr:Exocyst complex component EXO70A1 [Zea mays]AQK58049.1 Exocyst complex component EXO70A1 [Zea mays]PWZ26908.1 hypothetical protein Zm00014a_042902 [Zea mays]PWZ26909.1 Exocyst complex component EXO70A1 [Zea mays]PWZ26910.1 hypothetical protein Zm00014a_042902 [Zea mays]